MSSLCPKTKKHFSECTSLKRPYKHLPVLLFLSVLIMWIFNEAPKTFLRRKTGCCRIGPLKSPNAKPTQLPLSGGSLCCGPSVSFSPSPAHSPGVWDDCSVDLYPAERCPSPLSTIADLSSDETPEKHTQTKFLWCDLGSELKSCRFKSRIKKPWGSKVNNNRC